jgi:hypothetical protein
MDLDRDVRRFDLPERCAPQDVLLRARRGRAADEQENADENGRHRGPFRKLLHAHPSPGVRSDGSPSPPNERSNIEARLPDSQID